MKKCSFTVGALLLVGTLAAQITLDNASFEDERQDATVPSGWHACEKGSTPDILPGSWGVSNEPFDGDSYMGLITRQDGTWESVGQRLSQPMQANSCYNFSVQLAHSKTYANYNKPIKLRIWGGHKACTKDVLLTETAFVNHAEWRKYAFQLFTKKTINYLIMEAHYMEGLYFHYNGNILIDNCSTLSSCKRAEVIPVNWSEPVLNKS